MSLFKAETREEIIKEIFPSGEPDLGSGDYVREAPQEWVVSRARLLDVAILNGDEGQIKLMVHEYARVVGIINAIEYFFNRYERLVTRAMEQGLNPDYELDTE